MKGTFSTINRSLPNTEAWTSSWIEPVEPAGGPVRQRPAYYLAGEFAVPAAIESAYLHATAHGVYEAFLNGRRIGDCELTPGFTAYRKRLQVQTFDVTDLLVEGRNALGAIVSDGWWRGQSGVARRVDDYGNTTALLAQLELTLESGNVITLGTDATWRSCASHILRADLIAGEVHDLRRRIRGWAEPGTDRSSWDGVRVADHGFDSLCVSPAPPVRRVEELRPVSIRELARRRWVVDFGQNSNGWVRLRKLGPIGTQITLIYGEALDRDGDVTQANVASGVSAAAGESVTFQVDTVISAGSEDDDVFEPRHSTKGFQYVRVDGHPGPLQIDDITSIVVHTDFRRTGSFACSDERINRLHCVAEWSFRGNACDIPTDCPTRERAGWTGDWQIYVETAAYLYDVAGFSRKWLHDLAAEQWENGAVTNLVPEPHPMDDREPAYWKTLVGSAGWGDAAVHIPWEIYRATGNQQILAEQWPSMQAWVDFATHAAATGRHASRVECLAEPAPHERYIWDSGFHFGEWLEPGQSLSDAISLAVASDHGALATAYLFRSAWQTAETATVLGRRSDGDRYAELAENTRQAWWTEFIDDNGRITPHTQATLVRALAFDLVPSERAQTARDLVALIRVAGTHLGTGFLATPFLLPVLADSGHLEVAYELLFQDTSPSWLLMIARGATTIWEEWEGIDADGSAHASLNHYSKGAVISFLHRYTAGLQILEPGYRRFRVAPRPGGGITSAHTHHDSPYGRIEVAWQLNDDAGEIDVTVPAGTEADLLLPDGTTTMLAAGRQHRTWSNRS